MVDVIRMHERGQISDEALLLYGISGDLPELHVIMDMTPRQRVAMWSERLDDRLGQDWRERLRRRGLTLPTFLQMVEKNHNWLKEGF